MLINHGIGYDTVMEKHFCLRFSLYPLSHSPTSLVVLPTIFKYFFVLTSYYTMKQKSHEFKLSENFPGCFTAEASFSYMLRKY